MLRQLNDGQTIVYHHDHHPNTAWIHPALYTTTRTLHVYPHLCIPPPEHSMDTPTSVYHHPNTPCIPPPLYTTTEHSMDTPNSVYHHDHHRTLHGYTHLCIPPRPPPNTPWIHPPLYTTTTTTEHSMDTPTSVYHHDHHPNTPWIHPPLYTTTRTLHGYTHLYIPPRPMMRIYKTENARQYYDSKYKNAFSKCYQRIYRNIKIITTLKHDINKFSYDI